MGAAAKSPLFSFLFFFSSFFKPTINAATVETPLIFPGEKNNNLIFKFNLMIFYFFY